MYHGISHLSNVGIADIQYSISTSILCMSLNSERIGDVLHIRKGVSGVYWSQRPCGRLFFCSGLAAVVGGLASGGLGTLLRAVDEFMRYAMTG